MNQLGRIIKVLHGAAARYPGEFARGQARQPLLAPYKDAQAALGAARREQLPDVQRAALVCALLEEHQQHPHALWQAMVTVVFAPTLTWLRRRVSPGERDEDLDQEILVAFYEALAKLPPARTLAWPFLAVRRATARPLFRSVLAARREHRLMTLWQLDARPDDEGEDDDREDDTPPWLVDHATEDRLVASLDDRKSAAIARSLAEGDPELRALLDAPRDGATTLREHVDAVHRGEPREARDLAYQRLRRAKRRLDAAVLARLARPTREA